MLRICKWFKRAGLAIWGILGLAVVYFIFSPKEWHSNITDKQWQTAIQQTIEGLGMLGGCVFGMGFIWERYFLAKIERQKKLHDR
jgi:hypothetical protein